MNFYNEQHRFYCGVDLHTRTMSVHILDANGQTVLEQTMAASPQPFLQAIAPYRNGLVVACECVFTWYWFADLCHEEGIPFVLGHALYMKAIHGGKSKNDKIDAKKIAVLLRGGMLPQAYVYPKGMRETRDLLRRRTFLVRKRAEALTHLQQTNSQYNHPPFATKLNTAGSRADLKIPERFADPSVRKNVEVDLALIANYDEQVRQLELYLKRTALVDDPQAFARLQTIPGIGRVLGLTLLYEIHDIRRFPEAGHFLSYARLVRCCHESAGKKQGSAGNKIGNAHMKWAFSEATCMFLKQSEQARKWKTRREKKHGKPRAMGTLAARLGRAVYHLLRKGEAFDMNRFFSS